MLQSDFVRWVRQEKSRVRQNETHLSWCHILLLIEQVESNLVHVTIRVLVLRAAVKIVTVVGLVEDPNGDLRWIVA